jgi:hypothetical protein
MLNFKIKAYTNHAKITNLKQQHNSQWRNTKLATRFLWEDQEWASWHPEEYFRFVFDLQKSLSHPRLSISTVYYKCDTPVFNIGSCNIDNDNADMYVWEETTATRGSRQAVR